MARRADVATQRADNEQIITIGGHSGSKHIYFIMGHGCCGAFWRLHEIH